MSATFKTPVVEHGEAAGNAALPSYRERRAFEELERADLRRTNLAQQHAAINSADLRIRAWERAHQLRMPLDPLHPVLEAIAVATQLPLAEVRKEQRLRSARIAPKAPVETASLDTPASGGGDVSHT